MNYPLLKTRRVQSEYSNLNDVAFLAFYNALSLFEMQDILKTEFNNYVLNNQLNLKLRAITITPPRADLDTPIAAAGGISLRLVAFAGLDLFATNFGEYVNPDNDNLKNMIALLQATGIFSQVEVDSFWNQFKRFYSQSQLDHGEETTQQHLDIMRLQDKRAVVQALFDQAQARVGVLSMALAELDAGHDVEGIEGIE